MLVRCSKNYVSRTDKKFDSIYLSRRTVVRRFEINSANLMDQLRDASKDFLWYSLALDEVPMYRIQNLCGYLYVK